MGECKGMKEQYWARLRECTYCMYIFIYIYIYATSRVIKQYIFIQVGVPQSGNDLKLCKDIVSVSDPISYMLTLPWLRGPLGTWSFPAWRAVCRESRTSSTERPGWDPGDYWACRAHGGRHAGLTCVCGVLTWRLACHLCRAAGSFLFFIFFWSEKFAILTLTFFLDQSQHVHLLHAGARKTLWSLGRSLYGQRARRPSINEGTAPFFLSILQYNGGMVDARCLTGFSRPWRTDTTRPQISSPSCIKENSAMNQTVGKPSSGRLFTWRSPKLHLWTCVCWWWHVFFFFWGCILRT